MHIPLFVLSAAGSPTSARGESLTSPLGSPETTDETKVVLPLHELAIHRARLGSKCLWRRILDALIRWGGLTDSILVLIADRVAVTQDVVGLATKVAKLGEAMREEDLVKLGTLLFPWLMCGGVCSLAPPLLPCCLPVSVM